MHEARATGCRKEVEATPREVPLSGPVLHQSEIVDNQSVPSYQAQTSLVPRGGTPVLYL